MILNVIQDVVILAVLQDMQNIRTYQDLPVQQILSVRHIMSEVLQHGL